MLVQNEKLIELRTEVFKSQMDPHFIFNALNSVQYFIINNEKLRAVKYLSVLSKLLRKSLNAIGKEFVELDQEVISLKWYMQLQQLRYGSKLAYKFKVEKPQKNLLIPSLILQLCLEEIVERSILENVENRNLVIMLTCSNNSLEANFEIKAKSLGKSRDFSNSYRAGKTSWVNHVDQLNKLKGLGIKKKIGIEKEGNVVTTKFKLFIPLN